VRRDKGLVELMTNVDARTEEVCRPLLTTEVGWVAFLGGDDYPVVLPVNFFLDGDLTAFRTDVGGKLDSVPLRPVACEVEHLAAAGHSGWSILVQGRGQDLTDAVGLSTGRCESATSTRGRRARRTTGWPSRSTASRGAASCDPIGTGGAS
jgi:nitroimidazol reductase NimA-like FMN-containing flavoprotein (pyridoxamine 5'-phosphate oxidase superfamily)